MCSGVMKRVCVLKYRSLLSCGTMHNYTLLTTNGIHIYYNNHQKYFSYGVLHMFRLYTMRHDFLLLLFLCWVSSLWCSRSLPCAYFVFCLFSPFIPFIWTIIQWRIILNGCYSKWWNKSEWEIYGRNMWCVCAHCTLYKKNCDRLLSFRVFC